MADNRAEATGKNLPESTVTLLTSGETNEPQSKPQEKRPKRPAKPNYAKIHTKPLPLNIHPLPTFIPQNPLSLLQIAYVILRDYISPPQTCRSQTCVGHFSSETRSVHVTDPKHIRLLWEMGFFGKGTLSRSEPSWLSRERARRIAGRGGTSEEATSKRREERKLFKLERARLEREQIEEQLRQEKLLKEVSERPIEAPVIQPREDGLSHVFPWMSSLVSDTASPVEPSPSPDETTTSEADVEINLSLNRHAPEVTEPTAEIDSISNGALATNGHAPESKVKFEDMPTEIQSREIQELPQEDEVIADQEHLQLSLEEAFFLSYGLGVLQIRPSTNTTSTDDMTTKQMFTMFQQHASFPIGTLQQLKPDNTFLINYVVYHHYRSLGWVIRAGSKFSCDFLLYNRGPVFSHAEFAILIVPEYGTDYSNPPKRKDWWWLHCVNRVQSQVRKSLVLVYVQVPSRLEMGPEGYEDIGAILKQFKVRDFVIRRWLANRSRD